MPDNHWKNATALRGALSNGVSEMIVTILGFMIFVVSILQVRISNWQFY